MRSGSRGPGGQHTAALSYQVGLIHGTISCAREGVHRSHQPLQGGSIRADSIARRRWTSAFYALDRTHING